MEKIEELKQRFNFPPLRQNYNLSGKISVITPTARDKFIDNIRQNYAGQLYQDRELLIILNNSRLNQQAWQKHFNQIPGIRVFQLGESTTLGECLNFGISQARGDYISKMDDDDFYGPYYLTDQLHYLTTTEADVTGKLGRFIYFEESQSLRFCHANECLHYVNGVKGATFLVKRAVFNQLSFPGRNQAEDTFFIQGCRRIGFKFYAGDPFNYVQIRMTNKKNHTWQLNDQDLSQRNRCQEIIRTDNFKPLITC